MFFWGPGGGWAWVFAVFQAALWIGLIVAAVLLLRPELPHLRAPGHDSPALRLLEERYARGEITREEFLERRAVLLGTSVPPGPPPAEQAPSGPAAVPPEPPPAPPPPPEPPSSESPGPSRPPAAQGGTGSASPPPGPSAPPGAAPPYLEPEPPEPGQGSEPTQPIPSQDT